MRPLALSVVVLAGCVVEPIPEHAGVRLSGIVVDRTNGEPLEGARVYVPGTTIETTTGADGGYRLTLPEGSDEVAVAKDGYLDLRRSGLTTGARVEQRGEMFVELRLFPAVASESAQQRLSPRYGLTIAEDPADLREQARVFLEEARSRAGTMTLADVQHLLPSRPSDGRSLRALSPPPATIRIWRRGLDGSTSSCSGRVDVLPFEQYVKGVLPHEWIPSWDPKALEMGAIAIRTYAWWWVEAGGKYECADLDDTTASQVYEDEFLPKTDAAVDATAGIAIVKDGSLVFAEYSAENGDPTKLGVSEPHCSGKAVYGHGRGVCQWGTQRWAVNEGKDYLFMASHYFPGATVSAPPRPALDAELVAESYPAVMTSGEEAVVWLEYENRGTDTWDVETTRVGTTVPRDRSSPFYVEGNWISPQRPTAADHSSYGPGAIGRFTFVIRAPEVSAPTTFVEHFGLVEEGVRWFGPEDDLVTWTIQVNPRNDSSSMTADPVGSKEDDVEAAPITGGCRISPASPRGRREGMRAVWLALLGAAVLRRGRRWAMLGAAAFFLGTGCQSSAGPRAPAERRPLGGDSELIGWFEEASRESGVPAEILATIAYVQTRLSSRLDQDPHRPHGLPAEYGVMGLGAGGLTSVEEAAWLLGLDPELVKYDPRSNIRAAAALLSRFAADRGEDTLELADWAPVLEAYGGASLAADVMTRLERGWRGYDDEGRWVVVSARSVGGAYAGIGRQTFAAGFPGAIWNPAYAGNYSPGSRGAAQINYIVIHTVQGSYSGCISWFKNPSANVSAHYVVRSSDGEITQMVDDSDVAYHDACFNSQSIGIEHEGYVSDPGRWYTEEMYAASARLTAWLADQYGIPKDRAHIMGHGETPDCSDHTDPGGGWDWEHYMELVRTGGRAIYDAEAGATSYPTEMVSGEEVVAWIEFVNRGNSTWGLNETRLGTAEPQDRESPFFVEGNWLAPNRATGADHSNYGPGSTGRFTFVLRAPEVDETTVFTESFQLVQEGVEWFGPVVTLEITVHPREGATPGETDDFPSAGTDPVPPPSPDDGTRGDERISGGCSIGGPKRAWPSGEPTFGLIAACAMLIFGALSRRRRH